MLPQPPRHVDTGSAHEKAPQLSRDPFISRLRSEATENMARLDQNLMNIDHHGLFDNAAMNWSSERHGGMH